MFLISAKVESFKSINTPQTVLIDDEVTVLVGMNEAGKTVFLKALEKSNDAQGLAKFDPVSDYPRKGLIVCLIASLGGYLGRKHDGSPGPKTMWIGLQRMRDFVIALEAREALAATDTS